VSFDGDPRTQPATEATSGAVLPDTSGPSRWWLWLGGAIALAAVGVVVAFVSRGVTNEDTPHEASSATTVDDGSASRDIADLRVFFGRGASRESEDAVRQVLENERLVTRIDYMGDVETLADYTVRFPDEAEPAPGLLPTSFAIDVEGDTEEIVALIHRLEELPEVREITNDTDGASEPLSAAAAPMFRGEVLVFFHPGAAASEIARVRTLLDASPTVARLEYVDQEAALREFNRMFADDPVLLASVEADGLPSSFGVHAAGNPLATLQFACGLQGEPGVREVAGFGGGTCPSA